MSRKQRKKISEKKTNNLGRKFRIFVKPVDEFGFPEEDRFGWISYHDKSVKLMLTWDNSIIFEEKEDGHGSFEDWKKFFLEEHKDWRIENGPTYVNEEDGE